MTVDTAWREDLPDFEDDGKKVVVDIWPGGVEVECVLDQYDSESNECGHYPLFKAIDAQGNDVDFIGAKRWRFA